MDIQKLEAMIEAILFTMGESVPVERIADAIGQDVYTTKHTVHCLMEKYETEGRGIKIIELDNSYQMCTKAEMYEVILKIAKQIPKKVLTDILLETLAIIAYKQPITKLEIEKIRGVKSDHAVNKLIEYHLIHEAGRLDAPGKPLLFGTTEEFLRGFGVQSIDELPVPNSDMVADFKTEAEKEVQIKLQV